jgi:hypothetical protein
MKRRKTLRKKRKIVGKEGERRLEENRSNPRSI